MSSRSRPIFVFGALLVFPLALLRPAPLPAPRVAADGDLQTYAFLARVTNNGGIVAFPIGKAIHGSFTYDQLPPALIRPGSHQSPKNTFEFFLDRHHFRGDGPITFNAGHNKYAEHISIATFDLKLPAGWRIDRGQKGQSFGIILQNSPPVGVITTFDMPQHIDLSRFTTTADLRLDFSPGAHFPDGQVLQERTIVRARIEKLNPVAPVRRR